MEGKSLKDYWHEAKRVIGKWGKWEWQKDDECVAFVSYWMMRADWKYAPDKGAKRATYRITSGRWALVSWAGKLKKRDAKAKETLSLNYRVEDDEGHYTEFGDTIVQREPEETDTSYKVNKLVNHSCLSESMKKYLKKYYVEGYNCVEIARQCDISKQAVSEGIRRGVERLKSVTGVDEEEYFQNDCLTDFR